MAKRMTKKEKVKMEETIEMIKETCDLSDKLIAHIRKYPDGREACLLVMLISLWKRAVHDKKIDAVAMGAYGMQHFFNEASEDCGKIGLELKELLDGEMGIVIYPIDGVVDGDGKVGLT